MAKTLIILAGAASLGFAVIAVTAVTGSPIDRRTAAEVSHAVVAGEILGSGVWPYNLILGPTELQPRLILGSADCEAQQPQCPLHWVD